jgi:hypothetical protein
METDSRYQRYFIHLKRAWYGDATLRQVPYLDEVNFGLKVRASPGTTGEMAVRWSQLGRLVAPRLEVFDDGWTTLSTFCDVLEQLGRVSAGTRRSINPAAFCALLESCGFVDLTPLKPPERASSARYELARPVDSPER